MITWHSTISQMVLISEAESKEKHSYGTLCRSWLYPHQMSTPWSTPTHHAFLWIQPLTYPKKSTTIWEICSVRIRSLPRGIQSIVFSIFNRLHHNSSHQSLKRMYVPVLSSCSWARFSSCTRWVNFWPNLRTRFRARTKISAIGLHKTAVLQVFIFFYLEITLQPFPIISLWK